MNMIHAEKLVYEYDKRDEEGNVIGTNRAIDGVDIDVPQGSFVAVLGHNGSKVYSCKAYECNIDPDRRYCMGGRTGYERSGESVGRAKECGNGISKS